MLTSEQVTDELCEILFKFNPQKLQALVLNKNKIT